jgi:hypothetical protein
VAGLAGVAGCATLGRVLDDLLTERPPAPLDLATTASDARLDSSGAIAGSFIGEGTSRQVHLLSSDTGLIAALARRYRPERDRRGDTWQWLATRGTFGVNVDPSVDPVLASQGIRVGSPAGHSPVTLRTILLHGSSCGWRGAQAEFIVEPSRAWGPSLRGPVVGSFMPPGESPGPRVTRDEPPSISYGLTDTLLAWTADAMDSMVSRRLSMHDLPLSRVAGGRPAINTLDDDDAADVVAFQLEDGRVRYAVSLRERRTTARGATLLASTVMVWDAGGVWRQVVFRPTLIEYRRHRLARSYDGLTPPVFWRRLQPVSGFAFRRDYIWMEQVNAEDGGVLWVMIEPRGNLVVAAAEVEDPC